MLSRDNRLYLAWVIALVATLGSLYFSEIKGFRPCILCWYQRVCMYPLALFLGMAVFKKDWAVRRYVLPLAGIGIAVALYQNLEVWELVPAPKACTIDPASSCGIPWPIWGQSDSAKALAKIVTIPVLSMVAFGGILGLLGWEKSKKADG